MKWYSVAFTGRVQAKDQEQAQALLIAMLRSISHQGEVPEYVHTLLQQSDVSLLVETLQIGEEVDPPTSPN